MGSWLARLLTVTVMVTAPLTVQAAAGPEPVDPDGAPTTPPSDGNEPGAEGTPTEGEPGADGTPGEPGAEGTPAEGEPGAEGTPTEGEPGAEGTPTEGEPGAEGTPTDGEGTPTEGEPGGEDQVAVAEPVGVQSSEVLDPPTEGRKGRRPRHTWIYSNLTAVRYNPLGLVNEFTTGYRYQLSKKVYSALFRDSFVAAQLHTYITPAYGRIGPKIDIQPIALLNLSATYDYTGYFGTFGLFQSFVSPTEEWSDNELNRRRDSPDPLVQNYSTTGHFITLSALLQAKVKNIAVRDNLKFYWADFDLRDGDTVYYHQTLDLPQPDRGWTLTNDLDLLYLFKFGLTLGARYTVTHAFYKEEHFQPTEPLSMPNGPTHRIGPAILYTFFDRPDLRFNKPTLIVLSQFWAKHRFRAGQQVSPAIPYLVIGFRFQGEFLPNPASWHKKTEPKRKKRRNKSAG